MRHVAASILVSLLLAFPARAAGPEAEAAFARGVELMDKRRFGDALVALKEAERLEPGAAPLLWNLGIASAELGNHSEALGYWRKYKKAAPEDWRAQPKIIQAHQALGDTRARDREIKALYLARTRDGGELGQAERFCREQLDVAGRRVLVFETFVPDAVPNRVYWRFAVTDEAGKETLSMSLGSYDSTTQMLREMGIVKKDGRAYHVDWYEGNEHRTYAQYQKKPPYEEVRKVVIEALRGQRAPLSGAIGK